MTVTFDHANHILEKLRNVVRARNLYMDSNPRELLHVDDWGRTIVRIAAPLKNNKLLEIASFHLQQMPGCCAILTMSYVNTRPAMMSFADAVEIVEDAAKRAAFGSIVLTQVINPRWKVEKHEWYSLVDEREFLMSKPFINGKSGNQVVYLTKNLGQDDKMAGFEERILA